MAVNPTNPNNIVVAWIKGMFGTSFIAVQSSYDGGITWSSVRIMPHVVSGSHYGFFRGRHFIILGL